MLNDLSKPGKFSAASASRPLPALSREAHAELRVFLALAVRETGAIGATPGLLQAVAKDFLARRLAGEIEQLVKNEIELQVKNGLFVTEHGGHIVRLVP